VGIGAQRGEFQSAFLGDEGEGVDFDLVEDVFAAGERWKEIVDLGEERVAAEFPRIPASLEIQRLRQVKAAFVGAPGQNGRPSKTFDNARQPRANVS
jgi:hypothetical protein